MNKVSTFAAGITVGAGAVYFLDPELGRRRRALFRDRLGRLERQAQEDVDAAARDLSNRARGAVARLESRLERDGDAPDDLILARVKSCLGHTVSHPRSIAVEAHDGRVVLSGPVLSDEEWDLVRSVRRVPGVKDVESYIEVHDDPGHIPGLQGSAPSRRSGLLDAYWPPAWQLLAGVAGAFLVATGRLGVAGRALSRLVGALLLLRAVINPLLEHGGRSVARRAGRPREDLRSTSSA